MAKGIDRLTAMQVEKAKRSGVLHDGKGLYLHVGLTGGKSWLLRYQIDGRARWMGLGPYPELKLAEARQKRDEARTLLKVGGIDPLAQRKAQQNAKQAEAANAAAEAITFRVCAGKTIAAKRSGWRNGKHADQWTVTLATYAYPVVGDLVVAAVETGHITQILEPIWTTKNETASRLRGRIENVLDFAKTHGWRTGENPARWKGHLENVLPKPSTVAKVEHHAALYWREIGAFMEKLREQEGVGALALRCAILTAARTGEVIGARWSEIDLQSAVWTVPAERMKAGRMHRVPLSEPALALLREVSKLAGSGADPYIFPGMRSGAPLSNMALLMMLRRMSRGDLTAHGFRSTFRDWAAETGKPADVAEAALAHTTGDKTVQAYLRGDLFERRRKLMDQWADFCSRPAPAKAEVTRLYGLRAG